MKPQGAEAHTVAAYSMIKPRHHAAAGAARVKEYRFHVAILRTFRVHSEKILQGGDYIGDFSFCHPSL